MFSCLSLLECSVLTWHPAGDVHVTCMLGGSILLASGGRRGGQITPGRPDCLRVNSGHVTFLRIRSAISNCIRKNMPAGFRLGSGATRIQAYLATLNPGGAPSSLVQVDGPVHGLSAGGLQGASCQKQGVGEGVLHGHLPSVRLVNLSAK